MVQKTKKEEYSKVIELINHVFRTGRGNLPHTMEKEFPLLFSIENRENMRIIKTKDEEIISVVSFLYRKMLVNETPLSIAFIGGVCTHENYRKKGLSSIILEDVEDKMIRDKVSVCFISGTRNLYKRWGANTVNNILQYKIFSKNQKLSFNIREYEEKDLDSLEKIYHRNTTRFLREGEDFKILIDSGTFAFGDVNYKRYVLEKKNEIIGYIILMIINDVVEVKEAEGDRENIFKALEVLGEVLNVKEIKYNLHENDKVSKDYKGNSSEYPGTLKIINSKNLLEELKPYCYRYFSKEIIEKLEIKKVGEGYKITLDEDSLFIKSHKELVKLIFEKKRMEKEEKNKLEQVLDIIFPIPLPWVENLNYQ